MGWMFEMLKDDCAALKELGKDTSDTRDEEVKLPSDLVEAWKRAEKYQPNDKDYENYINNNENGKKKFVQTLRNVPQWEKPEKSDSKDSKEKTVVSKGNNEEKENYK